MTKRGTAVYATDCREKKGSGRMEEGETNAWDAETCE